MPGLRLSESNAADILRAQGFIPSNQPVDVRPLGGGVSATVLLAESTSVRLVLKQPHTAFRVRDEWRVDDRRAFAEYAFARALPALLPNGSLARVRSFLPEARILIFDAAPVEFTPWKSRLLDGAVDPRLGESAGRLLAAIHDAGDRPELFGRFRHPDLFEEQRLDPYLATSARREPALAPSLARLASRFGERADLVHGDFSPKNLLTDGSRLILVDHEVATRGDAAFDVGFLLTHLVLKAVHLPQHGAALVETGSRFLGAYGARRNDADAESRAVGYLGGLLVARVLGKSPAEYLNEDGRKRALGLGRAILARAPQDWSGAVAYLGRAESPAETSLL